MSDATTFWYIEPLDERTNQTCTEELAEDHAYRKRLCADGKEHPLWDCAHLDIRRFDDSRVQMGLRFRMWVQDRPNAPIRQWKLEDAQKRKKAARAA